MNHGLYILRALAAGILLLILAGGSAQARDVTIAAASDLKFALDEIVAEFRTQHPQARIEVIYGSSGRMRAQIAHGAPFDLFFSADIAFPRALAEEGHAASPVVPYAVGRIVLWSARHDASKLRLTDLEQPQFRRIAIANPRHAPYGQRAEEALQHADVLEALRGRLVFGENIAQAAQFVESGAADIGIIALALALNPHLAAQGAYWLIPADWHAPLEQGFIVTRRAADNELAHAFADYMQTEAAQEVLSRYGFELPTP